MPTLPLNLFKKNNIYGDIVDYFNSNNYEKLISIKLLNLSYNTIEEKYQIVIVGAGTAGISVAARLYHDFPDREWQIAIIDPSEKHYYQPLWTLVGAGIFKKEESERNQVDLFLSLWRTDSELR